jgi:uncharacterized protein YycO
VVYIGNGKVVEALPDSGVVISDISRCGYPNETCVAVYRPMISRDIISDAVKNAKRFGKKDPPIPFDGSVPPFKSLQPNKFYCSELVWADMWQATGRMNLDILLNFLYFVFYLLFYRCRPLRDNPGSYQA